MDDDVFICDGCCEEYDGVDQLCDDCMCEYSCNSCGEIKDDVNGACSKCGEEVQ
ncbi:MAG: hypothetical protein HRU28_00100 [Rhizobiales bacterium]|nr:hypothetical protein [Hyphomicrobiales bacterium]